MTPKVRRDPFKILARPLIQKSAPQPWYEMNDMNNDRFNEPKFDGHQRDKAVSKCTRVVNV